MFGINLLQILSESNMIREFLIENVLSKHAFLDAAGQHLATRHLKRAQTASAPLLPHQWSCKYCLCYG